MAIFLKNVTVSKRAASVDFHFRSKSCFFQFHGILLDAIMDQSIGNKDEWLECARLLEEGMKKGVVVPLPASVFRLGQSGGRVSVC